MPVSTRKRALDVPETVTSSGKKDKKTTPKRKLFAAQEDDIQNSSKKGRKSIDVAPLIEVNTVVAVKTPVKSSEKSKSVASKSTPTTKSPSNDTWKTVPSAVKVVSSAVKNSTKPNAIPPTPKTNSKAKKVIINTPTTLITSPSTTNRRSDVTIATNNGGFWSNYKAAFVNAMRTLTPIFVAIFLLCYIIAQYYTKINNNADYGQKTAMYGIGCFVVYIAMLVAYSIALIPVVYLLKDK